MRRKLIATICALAAFGTAGVAWAGIPIAVFPFNSAAELTSFTKIAGTNCTQKFVPAKQMSIALAGSAVECAYRDSVVSASDDTSPTQDIQATVGFSPQTPTTLQRKTFLSVIARSSGPIANTTSGYELRVVPASQKWFLIRRGATGPEVVLKSGTLKTIKPGAGLTPAKTTTTTKPTTGKAAATTPTTPTTPAKPTTPTKTTKAPKTSGSGNILRLRTFGSGTACSLIASINGTAVFQGLDPNASPPSGHFSGIVVGNKAGKAGKGIIGLFDDVTIQIPNPF